MVGLIFSFGKSSPQNRLRSENGKQVEIDLGRLDSPGRITCRKIKLCPAKSGHTVKNMVLTLELNNVGGGNRDRIGSSLGNPFVHQNKSLRLIVGQRPQD